MAFTLTQPYPCLPCYEARHTLAAIFYCLLLLLCLYYIDAWWKLVLSGLWGECCVCDLGAWRVRVVSTKLEYLGQVLPWGATWAPLEMDTCGGYMVYEVALGVNL